MAALFAHNRIVGRGRATEAAAHRLIDGVPWDRAGEPSPSAGNGAAMRSGPVGFLDVDRDRLIRIADDAARVTHLDPRARAAAVLVALVVSDAINNGPAPADQRWFDGLAEAVEAQDATLAAGVRRMPQWLEQDPAAVGEAITRQSTPPAVAAHAFERWHGISPFATPSVLYALFAYTRTPTDTEETLRVSVGVGGDVDTVAAMAGHGRSGGRGRRPHTPATPLGPAPQRPTQGGLRRPRGPGPIGPIRAFCDPLPHRQESLRDRRLGTTLGAMTTSEDAHSVAAAWDERYRTWTDLPVAEPNAVLVDEADRLVPGRALDVGCGIGTEAIWLARHGWTVTALDVSQVVLDRAANRAADAGVQVQWRRGRLEDLSPHGFDLVSAHYPALRRSADGDAEKALLGAVAPGGTLLVVHHADVDAEAAKAHGFDLADYVSHDDVVALFDDDWDVRVERRRPRSPIAGTDHTRDDIVSARRLR